MRSPRVRAIVLALLPVLVVGMIGCRHKAPPPAPQVSTAPPLPPSSMTQVAPAPKLPAPAQPKVGPPGSDQKPQEVQATPAKQPKRPRKHVVNPDVVASAAPPPSVAAAPTAPVPEPSLGQLSAGSGADSRERAAMSEQIHAQEMRLSKLKHPLNDVDEAITKQVAAFLSKAKQAVEENDLDGAQTLTTKAKVLLDELTQS